MILRLAAFWAFQTWDRRKDGAPPRTNAEIKAATPAPTTA